MLPLVEHVVIVGMKSVISVALAQKISVPIAM